MGRRRGGHTVTRARRILFALCMREAYEVLVGLPVGEAQPPTHTIITLLFYSSPFTSKTHTYKDTHAG